MGINTEDIKASLKEQMQLAYENRRLEQIQQRMIDRAPIKQKFRADQNELWKNLIAKSDEMFMSSLKGYETWITVMGEILSFCHLLRETISGEVGEFYLQILNVAVEHVIDGVQRLSIKLPDLQHSVSFTDDNKLDVASISQILRSDKLEFTAEQKAILDKSMNKGILSWLDQLGYKQKEDEPGVIVKKDDENARLIQSEFKVLRDDPRQGLDVFLSGEFGLKVTHSPRMS